MPSALNNRFARTLRLQRYSDVEIFVQKGLAVAGIARDDSSTLPGDDPFFCARMHRGKLGSEFEI